MSDDDILRLAARYVDGPLSQALAEPGLRVAWGHSASGDVAVFRHDRGATPTLAYVRHADLFSGQCQVTLLSPPYVGSPMEVECSVLGGIRRLPDEAKAAARQAHLVERESLAAEVEANLSRDNGTFTEEATLRPCGHSLSDGYLWIDLLRPHSGAHFSIGLSDGENWRDCYLSSLYDLAGDDTATSLRALAAVALAESGVACLGVACRGRIVTVGTFLLERDGERKAIEVAGWPAASEPTPVDLEAIIAAMAVRARAAFASPAPVR